MREIILLAESFAERINNKKAVANCQMISKILAFSIDSPKTSCINAKRK